MVATTATPPSTVHVSPGAEGKSELKALVETYYDVQRLRVAGNNRLKAALKGVSKAERLEIAIAEMKDLETRIARQIAEVVKDEPIYGWLSAQRGIGPVMSAALIASGLDPGIDKPSGWWRFAGVGVIDGKNQRKRRGEKLTYNGFLRRTLEVCVGQFLKSHDPEKGHVSFYAELYYQFRAESERDRPDMKPLACPGAIRAQGCQGAECTRCKGKGEVGVAIHHHRRAVMLTQRVFLTHLQQRWREVLGLGPARNLYIVEKEPGVHQAIPAP